MPGAEYISVYSHVTGNDEVASLVVPFYHFILSNDMTYFVAHLL